jgi:hypothetical protein
MQGPVARQGGVVFNAEYDRRTFSKRVQRTEAAARTDLTLSLGPGHRSRLEILPGEPVFAKLREKGPKRKRDASNPEVFSSLNGLRLSELMRPDTEISHTQEEQLADLADARKRFFECHVFMGIAATPCETASVHEARKLFVICTQGIMSVKVDANVVPGDELVLDFPMHVSTPDTVCCTPMRGAPRDKVTLIIRPFDVAQDVSCTNEGLEEIEKIIEQLKGDSTAHATNAKKLLRRVKSTIHGSVHAIGEALSCAGPGQLAKVRLYNRGPNGF